MKQCEIDMSYINEHISNYEKSIPRCRNTSG